MDVKNFFLKIISGSKGTAIPPPVREAFNQQFDNPLNTEWSKVEDHLKLYFTKMNWNTSPAIKQPEIL